MNNKNLHPLKRIEDQINGLFTLNKKNKEDNRPTKPLNNKISEKKRTLSSLVKELKSKNK